LSILMCGQETRPGRAVPVRVPRGQRRRQRLHLRGGRSADAGRGGRRGDRRLL